MLTIRCILFYLIFDYVKLENETFAGLLGITDHPLNDSYLTFIYKEPRVLNWKAVKQQVWHKNKFIERTETIWITNDSKKAAILGDDNRDANILRVRVYLLRKIPKNLFYNFYNVTTFEMSSFHINSISIEDFKNAGLLRFLDLSFNEITILPENVFSDAFNLEHINLSSNNIRRIGDGVFKLRKLSVVNLFINQLAHVDHEWFDPANLEDLRLTENLIESIDMSHYFANNTFTKLENFTLGFNPKLLSVKNFVKNSSKLFHFSISGCPLLTDSDDIFVDALEVYVSNANATICRISKRTKIYFALANKINKIVIELETDNRAEPYNLTTFDLSSNSLVDISNITVFINLVNLDLSSNLIESIDGYIFSKMNYLQSLRLRNNQLKNADFLNKFSRLDYLDLAFNQLDKFNINQLPTGLLSYHLKGNKFSEIESNIPGITFEIPT